MVMLPMNWLRAVRGLMILPAAYMPSIRSTRVSPVTWLTLTWQKVAPNACFE